MSEQKLSKPQTEFFSVFVDNMITSVIQAVLASGGLEMDAEGIKSVLNTVDTDDLVKAVGAEYLQRVSFAELKRVDKIMRSAEFQKVVRAGAEVGEAIQAELLAVIGPLIPAQELTQEVK